MFRWLYLVDFDPTQFSYLLNHSASLELTSFEYEEEGAVSERLRREVARGFQDDLLCNAGGAQNVQETRKSFIVAAAKKS